MDAESAPTDGPIPDIYSKDAGAVQWQRWRKDIACDQWHGVRCDGGEEFLWSKYVYSLFLTFRLIVRRWNVWKLCRPRCVKGNGETIVRSW